MVRNGVEKIVNKIKKDENSLFLIREDNSKNWQVSDEIYKNVIKYKQKRCELLNYAIYN